MYKLYCSWQKQYNTELEEDYDDNDEMQLQEMKKARKADFIVQFTVTTVHVVNITSMFIYAPCDSQVTNYMYQQLHV